MEKQWGIFIIMAFSIMPFFVVGENKNNGYSDLVSYNVSVFISKGTSICTTSDVTIKGEGEFKNLGTMWFANSTPAELYFSSVNSGDGRFIFSGNSDCTLRGAVTWSKVSMRTNGGYLFLDGNLTVTDSLELKTGIVDTGSSKVIFQNDLPNSLYFNNIKENNSYVSGSFVRAVAPNVIYYFPVGDENGFHPFLLQNAASKDDVEVLYDLEISRDWKLVIQNAPFKIENIGGWQVDSRTNFYPGVSLCDSENSVLAKDGKFSILYAVDKNSFSANYQQSLATTDGFYLLGSEKLSGGMYALANAKAIRLANFIYDSGSGETLFEIPEISKYSRLELTVYNRWGQQVYDDHNYYNGFNCSNFPQGTYYYELKLHQGESVEFIRNFIEIKREK